MSALGHYIERSGVASVAISLVREQSEQVAPPRALWVPFPLGRPLGSATDPEFQKNVMRQAFALLESASEPTLADYEGDDPNVAPSDDEHPWVCPLNLAVPIDESLASRLSGEVASLRPWAMQTRKARGRTLFGATGAAPEQVDDVAAVIAALAEGDASLTEPPGDTIEWRFEMPLLIRHLADDLRTHYHEAIAAQPGSGTPDHDDLNDWMFGAHTDDGTPSVPGTVLGEALLAIADRLTDSDHPMAPFVRGFIIPEGRYHGGAAF